MNLAASHMTGRAILAVAGVAAALTGGGCGGAGASTQTAGSAQTATSPQRPASSQTAAAKQTATAKAADAPAPGNKLLATVSATGGEATLTDSGGHAIARVRHGWYTVFVTVNVAGADFHLTGPSVNSATKSRVPGVALWGIHFLKGTYRYMNDRDAHATTHVLTVY